MSPTATSLMTGVALVIISCAARQTGSREPVDGLALIRAALLAIPLILDVVIPVFGHGRHASPSAATLLTAGIAVLALGWLNRGYSIGVAMFGSALGAALTGLVLTGIAG